MHHILLCDTPESDVRVERYSVQRNIYFPKYNTVGLDATARTHLRAGGEQSVETGLFTLFPPLPAKDSISEKSIFKIREKRLIIAINVRLHKRYL